LPRTSEASCRSDYPMIESRQEENIVLTPGAFARLRSILKGGGSGNLNLNLYKDPYIGRRIQVRMRATQAATTEEYLDIAERNPVEYKKLVSVLTINVTRFFRNQETFDRINQLVIPNIIRNHYERGGRRINVLSVGCSTGEEPYSVAILFLEHLQKTGQSRDLRVLGTDIDKRALFHALKGIYDQEKVDTIPKDILKRYFVATKKGYQIAPDVRNKVIFIKKDVFSYKMYNRFDLILARNILIYFVRSYQEKIVESFHRQLVRGGFLVLGRAESLAGCTRQLFEPISVADRIYRKI
jgi:chemotaxis protein methyltransferase CheR